MNWELDTGWEIEDEQDLAGNITINFEEEVLQIKKATTALRDRYPDHNFAWGYEYDMEMFSITHDFIIEYLSSKQVEQIHNILIRYLDSQGIYNYMFGTVEQLGLQSEN